MFKRKQKITMYMKSGNVLKFKADYIESTSLSKDERTITIHQPDVALVFDVREVEAMIARK